MTAFYYLEGSYQLITALRAHGCHEMALRLEESIRSGSTGNEVAMGIRWNIARFLKDDRLTGSNRAMGAS